MSEMQTHAKHSGGLGRRSVQAQALEFLGGGQGQLGWWTWVLAHALDQLVFFSFLKLRLFYCVY